MPNWRVIELLDSDVKAVKNGNPIQTTDSNFTENEKVFLRWQGNILAIAEAKILGNKNSWQILRGLVTL